MERRMEEEKKTKKQGEARTHRAGSTVFCSTQGYGLERDALRTSHNTPPPAASHHVYLISFNRFPWQPENSAVFRVE